MFKRSKEGHFYERIRVGALSGWVVILDMFATHTSRARLASVISAFDMCKEMKMGEERF
jgi:hypothetical protein